MNRNLICSTVGLGVLTIVVSVVWFGKPSRSEEERKFFGTWISEDSQVPRSFGPRYMAEFDGPNDDVGLWDWSIKEAGKLRLFKQVLGRTIENVFSYRLENQTIVLTDSDGSEVKLLRSPTPIPKLEEAVE